MKKLTILSATLLSSALISSACSSTSEKKEETNKHKKAPVSRGFLLQLWIKMEKQ